MTDMNQAARQIDAIVNAPLTGDYAADCAAGRNLARDVVAVMSDARCPVALGYIVEALVAARQYNAVHIGFFSQIAEQAI